jgi:hypothetical protein
MLTTVFAGKRPLQRPKKEANIETAAIQTKFNLAEDGIQRRTVVPAVMNIRSQ